MNTIKLASALILFFSAIWLGRTEVLLQESFDYPDGSLVQVGGARWQHHSGTRDELQVTGGRARLTQDQSEDVNRSFGMQPAATNGFEQLFASFDLQVTTTPKGASGSYFLHFKDAATGFRGRVFLAPGAGDGETCQLGVAAGANTPSALHPEILLLHSNYHVVMGYLPAQGTARLWVNPASLDDPSVVTSDEASTLVLAGLALRQSLSGGNGMGGIWIDNLVVATQAEDLDLAASTTPRSPSIVSPPSDQTAVHGATARFTVAAFGTAPIFYQWYHDQEPVPGATNALLELLAVTPADAGLYHVTLSNQVGAAVSPTARLEIVPNIAKPPRIRFTNEVISALHPWSDSTNSFSELTLCPGEGLTIRVVADAEDEHEFALTLPLDGLPSIATWNAPQLRGCHLEARFDYVVPIQDAGRRFEVHVLANNGESSNEIILILYIPSAQERALVMTEVLANPSADPASPLYNPLQRLATTSRPTMDDEFIELVNFGSTELDLSGWSLADAQQARHVFATGCALKPGEACVVYGGPGGDGTVDLGVMNMPASASTSGLALNNSGEESILIRNANHDLVMRLNYRGDQLSPMASLCRNPEQGGAWVVHDSLSPLPLSPGRRNDGSPFQMGPATASQIGFVRVGRPSADGLRLEWQAQPGAGYTLWAASRIDGEFRPVVTGLQFAGEAGCCQVIPEAMSAGEFFRISSP
jgi:hypothetical protein